MEVEGVKKKKSIISKFKKVFGIKRPKDLIADAIAASAAASGKASPTRESSDSSQTSVDDSGSLLAFHQLSNFMESELDTFSGS